MYLAHCRHQEVRVIIIVIIKKPERALPSLLRKALTFGLSKVTGLTPPP